MPKQECDRCKNPMPGKMERGAVPVHKKCERCNRVCCTGCSGQFRTCQVCSKHICYECNAIRPGVPYIICIQCIADWEP